MDSLIHLLISHGYLLVFWFVLGEQPDFPCRRSCCCYLRERSPVEESCISQSLFYSP